MQVGPELCVCVWGGGGGLLLCMPSQVGPYRGDAMWLHLDAGLDSQVILRVAHHGMCLDDA
jgi:hypothetical protein